jgi:hypothetical protein
MTVYKELRVPEIYLELSPVQGFRPGGSQYYSATVSRVIKTHSATFIKLIEPHSATVSKVNEPHSVKLARWLNHNSI